MLQHPIIVACPYKENENGGRHSQWIRLRLPSCRHGFESQAHYLCFYGSILYNIL